MRTFMFLLGASVACLLAVTLPACEESMRSNYYDLGAQAFKRLGEPCQPDVPPASECGYAPQFYCSAGGTCASACSRDADCGDGASCVGKSADSVGECRLPTDGGSGPD